MAKKKIIYVHEKWDRNWSATILITKLQEYVDAYGTSVSVDIDEGTAWCGETVAEFVVSYERLETDEEFNTRVAAEKAQRLAKKKRKIADEARQHEEYLKLDAIFGKKKKIKLD
jgi:hypothetical protein